MKRLSVLAAGLLMGAAVVQFSGAASGQDGWVTLVDDKKMGSWTEVGKANWDQEGWTTEGRSGG